MFHFLTTNDDDDDDDDDDETTNDDEKHRERERVYLLSVSSVLIKRQQLATVCVNVKQKGEYTWVHSGIKRGYIQVHSGTFRYIRDVSTALPLTGDLGNVGNRNETWVHSVQPPQPYIILEGKQGRRPGTQASGPGVLI